jgi:hypothetical protein
MLVVFFKTLFKEFVSALFNCSHFFVLRNISSLKSLNSLVVSFPVQFTALESLLSQFLCKCLHRERLPFQVYSLVMKGSSPMECPTEAWRKRTGTRTVPVLFPNRDDVVNHLIRVKKNRALGDGCRSGQLLTKDEGLAAIAVGWATDDLWGKYSDFCDSTWRTDHNAKDHAGTNARKLSGLLACKLRHVCTDYLDDQGRIRYTVLERLCGSSLSAYHPAEIVALLTSSRGQKTRFGLHLDVKRTNNRQGVAGSPANPGDSSTTLEVLISAHQGHSSMPQGMVPKNIYQHITLENVREFGTILHWTYKSNVRSILQNGLSFGNDRNGTRCLIHATFTGRNPVTGNRTEWWVLLVQIAIP